MIRMAFPIFYWVLRSTNRNLRQIRFTMSQFDQYDFKGKKALIRLDFNVPLDKKSLEITDDTRMRAALPGIKKNTERRWRRDPDEPPGKT